MTNTDRIRLAGRLREAREAAGLAQEEVARKLGVARSSAPRTRLSRHPHDASTEIRRVALPVIAIGPSDGVTPASVSNVAIGNVDK